MLSIHKCEWAFEYNSWTSNPQVLVAFCVGDINSQSGNLTGRLNWSYGLTMCNLDCSFMRGYVVTP